MDDASSRGPWSSHGGAPPSKAAMRRTMRALRRGLPDRAARSLHLWRRVEQLPAVIAAGRVLVFTTIPGEPETAPFVRWCTRHHKLTAVPEDDVDVGWPEVVLVPGLAFTTGGDRLGQGGGWYDRFLDRLDPSCTTIGVAFAPQVVDRVPTEPHDVRLQVVVTDAGTWPSSSSRAVPCPP